MCSRLVSVRLLCCCILFICCFRLLLVWFVFGGYDLGFGALLIMLVVGTLVWFSIWVTCFSSCLLLFAGAFRFDCFPGFVGWNIVVFVFCGYCFRLWWVFLTV